MHYEDLITDVPGAKRELIVFVLIVSALTMLNVVFLFYRQQPVIAHRLYDYRSPFTFQNILHDGDTRFKACFHKNIQGGFYLCFLFPPPKGNHLREGFMSARSFESTFVDAEYMHKYVEKFKDQKWKQGRDLRGFQVKRIRGMFQVTPVF